VGREYFRDGHVGFNDQSWLDNRGHTIARLRRTDFGHMTADITIDDPKAHIKPFTITLNLRLFADTELIKDASENEKDSAHSSAQKR
jgi:hypothetical protein